MRNERCTSPLNKAACRYVCMYGILVLDDDVYAQQIVSHGIHPAYVHKVKHLKRCRDAIEV